MRKAGLKRLAWLLTLALVGGCGPGLTGGSIPPGSGLPSRAEGLVIRGDNASVRVAGAGIRFEPLATGRLTGVDSTSSTGGGNGGGNNGGGNGGGGNGGGVIIVDPTDPPGTVLAVANDNGEFQATELTVGANKLTVTPPTGSGLDPFVTELAINDEDYWYLLVAPLPTGVSLAGLTGIQVTPAQIDLRVGQAVQLEVQLTGGSPPAIVPSYLVHGTMGLVNQQGRFTGVRAGHGSLRVLVGPYAQTIPIVVRDIG